MCVCMPKSDLTFTYMQEDTHTFYDLCLLYFFWISLIPPYKPVCVWVCLCACGCESVCVCLRVRTWGMYGGVVRVCVKGGSHL